MPNYVVLEETKGDELRVEVGRRAMRLEERSSRRDGIKMHYEFIKDMSSREHDKKGNWKHSRKSSIKEVCHSEKWNGEQREKERKRGGEVERKMVDI